MSEIFSHASLVEPISGALGFKSSLDADGEWRMAYGGKTIQQLFETQAADTPSAVALRFGGEEWTYHRLNAAADLFAKRLRDLGARAPQFVAIHSGRSIEMIVGLLAVLKAGCAYVALDAESPPDRLAAVLAQARPVLILTQSALAGTLPPTKTKLVELDIEIGVSRESASMKPSGNTPPGYRVSGSDLAYVSFTSGSSGSPRGVCIPHRGVVRLVKEPDYVSFRASDVFLHFAPVSFDASTFEIWGCLLNGARLAIFPPEKPSLDAFGEFIEREGVTILWLTAGLFHQMVDGHLHYLEKVRQLIIGGSVLSVTHVERALKTLPHCRVINGYGPTENTTFTCCHSIREQWTPGQSIPIGRPIARTYCRVLDEQGNPAPRGVPGELCAGGDGLALGYLGDPELTAQRFIPDRFSNEPGAKLYRTGDRVRELANGDYEFLLRMDRQVKIGGFRVELDEVEAVLALHPDVREAAVHVPQAVSGYEHLTAFISSKKGSTLAGADVREFLHRRLPAYMIPAVIVFRESLPLNANGKIDRAALLSLDRDRNETPAEEASATTEEALVKIWTEVLGFGGFTREQEFFHLGGTSLSATHLLAQIQTVLGKSVPMQVLLKGATILGMAKFLDEFPPAKASLLYPFQSKGDQPPLFCLPCQAGDLVCYANMERHLASDRPVYGVQSNRLFDIEEGGSLEEIAASCVETILRRQTVGPFHLFGYCFGGLLAYEVARQLWEKGAWIGAVVVLDYSFPDDGRRTFMNAGPSGVATFVSNLWRACGELVFSTAPERAAILSRLRMRVRGLSRGKRWDEALESEESAGCLTATQALYKVHDQACRNYVPGRYRGEVTLLRSRRMPIFRTHDPTYGWNEVQADKLRVKTVPGPGWHGAPLKEPYVARLVRIVECCMREAELTSGTPSLTPGPSALFSSTWRS